MPAQSPDAHRVLLRFNPHPPLRADAIPRIEEETCSQRSFNPHPPLRADAMPKPPVPRKQGDVSILTRPYGRMLLTMSFQ